MATAKSSLRDLLLLRTEEPARGTATRVAARSHPTGQGGAFSRHEAHAKTAPLSRPAPSPRRVPAHGTLPRDTPYDAGIAAVVDQLSPFYLCDETGALVAFNAAFDRIATRLFADTAESSDTGFLVGARPSALGRIIKQLNTAEGDLRESHRFDEDGEEKQFLAHHFAIQQEPGRENGPSGGHADIIGYAGIFQDVTPIARASRKAGDMESWLQDVIRSSSDWIWVVDHNLNVTFASPRISEALEIPAQMLEGRHLFTIGEFDPDDALSRGTRKAMERLAPFRDRHFLLHNRSGETRHILLSGIPFFEEVSGRFKGYRGTGTDITDRMRAEHSAATAKAALERTLDELRRKNKALESALVRSRLAEKAKSDFLAMMSHELRTPLNCVIGFSDAAMQKVHGPLDTAYVDYFDSINTAGKHLLAIISDILDTANIDTGTLSISSEPIGVAALLAESASMIEMKASAKKIDTRDLHVDRDIRVLGDRLRARQILVNLMANAVKFTPDGGRIGVDITEEPGNRVGVTVWDTGIGIASKDQDPIFEQFFKVDHDPLEPGAEGAGLGLNISRKLARLMGGDVTLSSEPGKGARFTLLLPKAPA